MSFVARSSEAVVEGDVRRLRLADLADAFVLDLAWPASANGGVEVEASGVLVSSRKPEVKLCFEGKAIVGKDVRRG